MSVRRLFGSDRFQAGVLVAPSVLALAAIALYPLFAAVLLSFRRVIVVFGEDRFVGLANYRFLLADPRFRGALAHTAYFAFVAVSIEFLLAMPIALLLHASFRGRGFLRAIVLIPWTIPTVVAARTWAFMFNPDFGLITRLLPHHDVNWLGMPWYAMHAAILVDVWKTTPFVALLLLAGLQGIPEDLYRAARIDGASRWQTFRAITLPLLRPAVLLALLFRTLDAFRVFDAVFVLTDGGPANTTETLSIYAYKTMMRVGDFGYGSTLAVVTFLCVVLISSGYLVVFGRKRGAQDGAAHA